MVTSWVCVSLRVVLVLVCGHASGLADVSTGTSSPVDNDEFVQKAPKLEFHVHLDGAYDLDLLFEFVQNPKFQDEFPEDTIVNFETNKTINIRKIAKSIKTKEQLKPYVQAPKGGTTLASFLEPFFFFNPIVSVAFRHNMSNLEEVAYRFVKRQNESNVVYTEVRFSPHVMSPKVDATKDERVNLSYLREVVDGVSTGLARGCRDFGLRVNMILAGLDRHPNWSLDVAELAREYMRKEPDRNQSAVEVRVVSMDIADGESHMDSTDAVWGKVRQEMRALHEDANGSLTPLHPGMVMHAGEYTTDEHVLEAVVKYDAQRIGHGYHVLDHARPRAQGKGIDVPLYDNAIMPAFRKRYPVYKDLHFEGCPSSSRVTGGVPFDKFDWPHHPIKTLYDNGFSVGINTDDPSVIGITLNSEWHLCLESMLFTQMDMLLLTLRQIESALLPWPARLELRRRIEVFYQQLGLHMSQGNAESLILA